MKGYVVKYHPEGWMSVKEDGLPDESGMYIIAVQTNFCLSELEPESSNEFDPDHALDFVTSAWFDYDMKLWQEDNMKYYNALVELKDVGKGEAVTYWQPMPTAPWDIFPKK